MTLTAVDNEVDGPETKTVTISATAENALKVTNPTSQTLTITDDDAPPTVTLALSAHVINESGVDNTVTVTARLDRASSAQIVVTVATASDYTLSTPRTLTFPQGETTSQGTVTLTAADNAIDAPDKTVEVGGTASNGLDVKAAALTIRDDDTRGVTVSPATLSIREGEQGTYTVVLDSEPTDTVTINVEVPSDAPVSASPASLTFGPNNWEREQAVEVRTEQDPDADEETATLTHSVQAGTSDYTGVSVAAVRVTVTDDESPSTTVQLSVQPEEVTEGQSRTVTVTGKLDGVPRTQDTEVTVTVQAGTAEQDDFQAAPATLTIEKGAVSGTASVTLTEMDDGIDEPDEETVTVRGTAAGTGLTVTPAALTIRDADPTPTVTLVLTPDSISEDGGESTVTATLSPLSSEVTTVTVLAAPAGEYQWSGTSLTIPAEATASTGVITLTAVDNDTDDRDKQVTVTGRAENDLAVNGPAAVTLTITDDDPPEVEGDATPAYMEHGPGEVARYTASNPDPRTISITWSLDGADKDAFTISNGVLRFTSNSLPDYEDPNNVDNEYTATVQASDGTFTGELAVTVRVQDALGTVRLSSNQPQVGRELTATVRDPDGVGTVAEWCWERSLLPAFPLAETHRIICTATNPTTTAAYTPVAADLGHYLRVTATYSDGQGTFKRVPVAAVTDASVLARPASPSGSGGGGGGRRWQQRWWWW